MFPTLKDISASGNRTPLSRDLFGSLDRHWQAGILTDILTRICKLWNTDIKYKATVSMYVNLYDNLFHNDEHLVSWCSDHHIS